MDTGRKKRKGEKKGKEEEEKKKVKGYRKNPGSRF